MASYVRAGQFSGIEWVNARSFDPRFPPPDSRPDLECMHEFMQENKKDIITSRRRYLSARDEDAKIQSFKCYVRAASLQLLFQILMRGEDQMPGRPPMI